MSGYRVVTEDEALDIPDGIEAAVRHCRNVADNVGSLLMRTFDDALPDDVVRKPEVIDNYESKPRPGSRHTWSLGQPQPAFPQPQQEPPAEALEPESWRVRAFYYALGQVESLWELSPLTIGDAVAFSYYFQSHAAENEVDNLVLRDTWVQWEAGRRASIEQGRPQVKAFIGPPLPNVDYLVGGEHDPNLGSEPSGWDDRS